MTSRSKRFAIQEAMSRLGRSRNLILFKLGMLKVSTLILALTDRCNLKCSMCDIWRKEPLGACRELDFGKVRQLFRLKSLKALKHITLSGGEPFLREDLYEIVSAVKKAYPRARINIPSNGTLSAKIAGFLRRAEKYGNIGLEFTLLGIKKHDEMTGVKGSFANLENTIHETMKRSPRLDLKAKFVITPRNFSDIKEVTDYCRNKNMPLTIKAVENVSSYTNSLDYSRNLNDRNFIFSPAELKTVIGDLKKIENNRAVNRVCTLGLIERLSGKKTNRECLVPAASLFINSGGVIYRCRMRDAIGSLDNLPFNFAAPRNKPDSGGFNDKDRICSQCVCLLRFLM